MTFTELTPLGVALRLGAVVVVYMVLRLVVGRVVATSARQLGHDPDRVRGMRAVINRVLLLGAVVTALIVLGVDLSLVPVYVGSLAAVIGVALFAHWSLLSNLTAGLILFMSSDLALGSLIRIIDGENSIEGRIIEFRVFSMVLRRDDGFRVVVPNTLVLQRPFACLEHSRDSRVLAPPVDVTSGG